MKQIIYLLALVILAASCQTSDQKRVETLKSETMAIHDEAMKDLTELTRVAREIKQFLTTATMTPEQSAVYMQGLVKMGEAENEMMAWMRDYQDPTDKSAAEAIQYLEDQKAKIKLNQEHIKAAVEEGKKLLPQQ